MEAPINAERLATLVITLFWEWSCRFLKVIFKLFNCGQLSATKYSDVYYLHLLLANKKNHNMGMRVFSVSIIPKIIK